MAIEYMNKIPEWKNEGQKPSEDLLAQGFRGGYKPPAGVFNWFWHLVSKSIAEIQGYLAEVSGRGIVYEEETKTLSLSGGGTSGGGSSGGGGTSGYILPVATKSRLGGVIIGEGISSEGDGRISPDYDSVVAKVAESYEAITEDDIKKAFEEEG